MLWVKCRGTSPLKEPSDCGRNQRAAMQRGSDVASPVHVCIRCLCSWTPEDRSLFMLCWRSWVNVRWSMKNPLSYSGITVKFSYPRKTRQLKKTTTLLTSCFSCTPYCLWLITHLSTPPDIVHLRVCSVLVIETIERETVSCQNALLYIMSVLTPF